MEIDKLAENEEISQGFKCNLCDEAIHERGDFMKHKKMRHSDTVLPCERFLQGMCIRNEDTCWFKHSPTEITQKVPTVSENQVFQHAPQNTAPPDQVAKMFQMMNSVCLKIEQMELKLQSLMQ